MGMFKPATRFKSKLRLALDGPSGSGKTFTALRFATTLGKKIAVINSESGAIQKYLGLAPDGIPWQFDVCELSDFNPSSYQTAIMAAGAEGYECLIIDSLSHAWIAALEMVDKITEASRSKYAFTSGWRNVTPQHNRLVESIIHSPCHVIATMRAKTEYVMESDGRTSTPRKVGMEAVQRNGLEYEFDIVGRMDIDHVLRISKSRCPHPTIVDAVVVKPTAQWFGAVVEWLNDGLEIPADAFAVTEADLEKLAKRESTTVPQQPAAVNPMDLLKQQQQQQQAAATVAPITTVVTSEPGFCTPQQASSLVALFAQCNFDMDAQRMVLQKRGVDSIRSLTEEQAATLIGNLQAKLNPPAAPQPEPTPPTEPTPTPAPYVHPGEESIGLFSGGSQLQPGDQSTNINGPCSVEQIRAIESALMELEQMKPGATEAFVTNCADRDMHVSDLTYVQADKLLDAIKVQEMQAFFDRELSLQTSGQS